MEDNVIALNDENGDEVEFEFIDLIRYKDNEYVVLLPIDDIEDVGEVVILRIEAADSDEEEAYVSVEDDSILNFVFEIFKERHKDDFNFVD